MRLCIVRTPQGDDNSLPKLLARSGAPASGRAQGTEAPLDTDLEFQHAWQLLGLAGIGTVRMPRVVAVPIIVVLTLVPVAGGVTCVAIIGAIIVGTACAACVTRAVVALAGSLAGIGAVRSPWIIPMAVIIMRDARRAVVALISAIVTAAV